MSGAWLFAILLSAAVAPKPPAGKVASKPSAAKPASAVVKKTTVPVTAKTKPKGPPPKAPMAKPAVVRKPVVLKKGAAGHGSVAALRASAPVPAKKTAALRPMVKSRAPAPVVSSQPRLRREEAAPARAPESSGAFQALEEEALAPDPTDPDSERIMRMQETLYSIVHGPVLGRVRVGIRVMEATSGRVFYERRAGVLMDPASNQKVLATATALMRLGATWRFRTEAVGPGPDVDGVIKGDLVLRGSGDPSLVAADLTKLASELASRGVTSIDGGVVADPRRVGSDETALKERTPLRVSRAAVVVRVRPGAKVGAAPSIVVSPMPEAFTIHNRATTRAKGRSKVTVSLSSAGGRMAITVGGRIAIRNPGVVLRRLPPSQPLFAAALLRSALIQEGITVRGEAGILAADKERTAGPVLLAVHESQPLSIMIRRINKDSDNEYADRLLEAVGGELYGGAATSAKGIRALREAITELGLPPAQYVPTNGSGLGHANRITADAMATLLHRIFLDPRFGPEILQSLSVGGVDGTTRNRFRGSLAAERVRAKTGTLNGKSCLSGYVGDGSDILIFSILCDGLRSRRLSAVRDAQVSAVNAMMRYVRGAEGSSAGEDVAPATDLEAGDENLESEEVEGTDPEPGAPPPKGVVPSLDGLLDKALRKVDLPPGVATGAPPTAGPTPASATVTETAP
jgi:D-alanyl-D-alanine carboxypeptidase/D-alanyl-D-alanine-endopeptidase (penicillin-binding protein 4)